MPLQKPGRSKQDYGTPRIFLDAVERTFGLIDIDLAATTENRVCSNFISPEFDSLTTPWQIGNRIAWLNPPFDDIAKWAKKCKDEQANLVGDGCILLLTPASIGSNWFNNYVWLSANVYAIKGRITFVGQKAPYPKDCILSRYHANCSTYLSVPTFNTWDWRIE